MLNGLKKKGVLIKLKKDTVIRAIVALLFALFLSFYVREAFPQSKQDFQRLEAATLKVVCIKDREIVKHYGSGIILKHEAGGQIYVLTVEHVTQTC
jgi:hypothetical protein